MIVGMSGVDTPKSNQRVSPVIEPGVQDLKIVNILEGTSQNGTGYVELELKSLDEAKIYSLKERFYVSPSAKPRLKYLYQEITGETIEGDIDTSVYNQKILNTVRPWLINGEEVLTQKNGTVYTNVRARVPYGDFLNPSPEANPFIKRLPKAEEATTDGSPNTGTSTSQDDDLPF